METRYKNKDRTNTTRRKCFSAKTIDMLRIRFFCSYSACLQFVSEVLSFVFFVFCASFQSVSEFRSFGVVRFVFDCSCVQLTSFRISVVHVFNLFQNSCRFVCLLSWFQPVSELPSFFVCCLLLHKQVFVSVMHALFFL